MKKLSDLLNNNPVARFSFDTPNVLFTKIKNNKPEKIPGTEGSPHMPISLVRTSLLRFLKILHKYLLYVNFGLFTSLVQFFGQNIWLMRFFGYLFHYCDLPYVRSREYRFTHINRSIVDIPFLSEALSGERI